MKSYLFTIVPKEMMQKFGVYAIKNNVNGKIYIGSTSQNFHSRLRNHIWNLKRKEHKNPILQRAWNKYGENAFEFLVLEELIELNILRDREQYYINQFKKSMYNICLLTDHPCAFPISEERRLKQSKNWVFVSPEKKIIKQKNMNQFCKDYNLNQASMSQVSNRVARHHKGWICYRAEKFSEDQLEKDFALVHGPRFKIISPNKQVFEVKNVAEFCREQGIKNASHFFDMSNKPDRRNQNGWIVERIGWSWKNKEEI